MGWDPQWAVAEKEGLNDPRWSGFRTAWQGMGGLGRRMAKVLNSSLRHCPRAVILGSDAPQVRYLHLEAARRALDIHDVALGPAADGGFWLLASRIPIPEEVLEAVPYSREDTRGNLIRALRNWNPGIRIQADLPILRDVDTFMDLDGLMETLESGGAQGELRAWLSKNSGTVYG